ncbi:flagellar protein FlgN [Paenibacillus sp. GYB004]|uniref:flagellar protein FlgN n=1 Tax=Paenibacillus sp. GYB004 TaxID=2994393 RepID=UPI002F961DBB
MEAVLQSLDQLIEVHRLLLELSRHKREAIVHNDVERLMQMTQKENKWTKRVEQLDTERSEAVLAYMRSRNMYVTGAITVSTLSKIVTKLEEKEALVERQQELVRLIGEIKQENELNMQLVEQSLAYINYSIDVFVGSDNQDVVYQHPQQEQHTYQARSMFDQKA